MRTHATKNLVNELISAKIAGVSKKMCNFVSQL